MKHFIKISLAAIITIIVTLFSSSAQSCRDKGIEAQPALKLKGGYTPVVGDYVFPQSFANSGVSYPVWDQIGIPGTPYTSHAQWVNQRSLITGIGSYNGVPIVYLQLANGDPVYWTTWAYDYLIKSPY